jgi:hypothetical protein
MALKKKPSSAKKKEKQLLITCEFKKQLSDLGLQIP